MVPVLPRIIAVASKIDHPATRRIDSGSNGPVRDVTAHELALRASVYSPGTIFAGPEARDELASVICNVQGLAERPDTRHRDDEETAMTGFARLPGKRPQ